MVSTNFKSDAEMMDWADARRREAEPQRRDQEMYASFCRAMDNGHQWLQRSSRGGRYDEVVNLANKVSAAQGHGPILTTINRITRMTRRIAAGVNPQKLEARRELSPGSSSPDSIAFGDVAEISANKLVEYAGLLEKASRSSQERCVDGQHAFGYQIVGGGTGRESIEAMEFDGYRLSLDPSNKSQDLQDHQFVIYTNVYTWDKAVSMFGEQALSDIDPENLSMISALMPVETKFSEITGGRMFSEYAQHANTKGIVISWVYLRGPGRRFDRLYIYADTGGNSGNGAKRDRVAIKYDNPTNPYQGSGLNFRLHNGWFRSGSRIPISDVGLMVDDQMKTNIVGSIMLQGYWNYTRGTLVVDKAMLEGKNTTATEILKQMQRGIMVVNRGGDKNSLPPQWLQSPLPSPVISQDTDYWSNQIRDSGFHAEVHEGRTKSHVPATSTQLAVELSAVPLDDRADADIRAYEAVITDMALTGINLARSGSAEMVQAFVDAGMTDSQLGLLSRMPTDRVPCKLTIAREGVIRRSRQRRFQEMQYLQSIGAIMPDQVRASMAELDMPLSQEDKDVEHYVNAAVADIAQGNPHIPVPLGEHFGVFRRGIKRAMMHHRGDPEVMGYLGDALDMQMEIEEAAAPPDPAAAQGGTGVPANGPPELPPQLELQDLLG